MQPLELSSPWEKSTELALFVWFGVFQIPQILGPISPKGGVGGERSIVFLKAVLIQLPLSHAAWLKDKRCVIFDFRVLKPDLSAMNFSQLTEKSYPLKNGKVYV